MAKFIIERNFAEQLNLTKKDVKGIESVNEEEGVRWLYSFLSADKRKSYCLYEADNPEAIRASARRLNVPADSIIEVNELHPDLV
jgi:hypothetical protein